MMQDKSERQGSLSDEEIAELLIQDRKQNFAFVVKKYADRYLFLLLKKWGFDDYEAEDIAQQTMVIAFVELQREETYPPERIRSMKLKAWLTRIAHNECYQRWWRRRKWRFESLPPDTSIESEALSGFYTQLSEIPEEVLEQKEFWEAIRCSLEKLQPEYREVIVLHLFMGMTHEQIAQYLDEKPTTIRSRYRRGLEKWIPLLIKELRDRGYGDYFEE